jgi:hypothetical protein
MHLLAPAVEVGFYPHTLAKIISPVSVAYDQNWLVRRKTKQNQN